MLPTQLEKLKAHSNHLLDGFLGLRQTYAFLEPMILNTQVIAGHVSGKRRAGFIVIRERLFYDCVQDIANLTLDADPRAPSLGQLIEGIRDEGIRGQLKTTYAVRYLPITDKEKANPAALEAFGRMKAREEEERRTQFDKHYSEVISLWNSFSIAPALLAFKTMRDKIVAHTELHFDGAVYKPVDLKSLGLMWKDLRETIEAMQRIVVLLGYIIRDADFAWEHFDGMMARDSKAYWGVE